MTLHNKILPIALVAALLGGTVGALVMHNNKTAEPAAQVASANTTQPAANNTAAGQASLNNMSADQQSAYREGFSEGFRSAQSGTDIQEPARASNGRRTIIQPTQVVYRRAPVRSRSYSRAQRSVYYDYNNAPRQRTFWQKHRDKLTVAMGTGGGALLGGLIGGKKGAAIGAITGGAGSALYTYKIRNRSRRY